MTPYPGGDTDAILSISQCKMTPQGVASIVHHLRQHPLFANIHEERLRAMAFAFLAYGGTNDNNHAIDLGSLHRIHYKANRTSRHGCWRNNMCESYVALVMDLLTWLDRLSGGATVMIHSPGTHLPGTWAIPEEAVLDVFLPYTLLCEQPTLRAVFAHLVQYFAQYVATAAMDRWDYAKGIHISGPLDDAGRPRSSLNGGHTQPLIPASPTPRHLFYGRGAGAVDLLVAAEGRVQPPPPTPPLVNQAPPAPGASQTLPVQTHFAKFGPEGVKSCESAMNPDPPSGKPPSLQHAGDESWTEVNLDAWVNLPIPELSPSDSASRQVSDSSAQSVSDSAVRKEVTRITLGADDLVSDLLYRLREMERVVTDQQTELVRLRASPARDSGNSGTDEPPAPSSSQSPSPQEQPSSEVEPPVDVKGKSRAPDSSGGSSLSAAPSMPPSPSSTVCDVTPPQSSVIRGPTLPPLALTSPYTSGGSATGGRTGPQLARSQPSPVSSTPTPSPVFLSPSMNFTPEDVPFGAATEHVVRHFKMPGRTHGYLRRVLQNYSREEWGNGIGAYLGVDDTIVHELVLAMRRDRPVN